MQFVEILFEVCMKKFVLAAFFSVSIPLGYAQPIWSDGSLHRSEIDIFAREKMYAVYLNPFLIREESEKMFRENKDKLKYSEVDWEEKFSSYLMNNDFSSGKKVVVARVLQAVNKSVVSRKVRVSNIVSAVVLPLNELEYDRVRKMPEVTLVNEIKNSEMEISSFPYYDYNGGGELVSWAKVAVNSDDGFSVFNPFYYVDVHPGALQSTSEYDVNVIYASAGAGDYSYHSSAIARIVGAKRNLIFSRGINPGQPLYLAATSPSFIFVVPAIEAAIHHADVRGVNAVLNISMNNGDEIAGDPYSTNPHDETGKTMLRASNRFLVTQSAGNAKPGHFNGDACPHVYNVDGAILDNDAILSVGAIDRTGDRMMDSINFYPGDYPTPIASRSGPCVDFYAPGGEIYAYVNQNNQLNFGSGTSYAAPIVAAIASRYGDTQTKPLVRESYVKSILMPTGYNDGGRPIKIPRYSPNPVGVLRHHPVIQAIAPVNNHRIGYIRDNNFFQRPEDFWISSDNFGSFAVDLGQVRDVKGVRIVLETSSPGNNPVNFQVFGSSMALQNNPLNYYYFAPSVLIKNHTEPFQYERVPIFIPLNGNYRSLRIDGMNPTSWFAVVEVEVYGF